jgi:hypothetical protein
MEDLKKLGEVKNNLEEYLLDINFSKYNIKRGCLKMEQPLLYAEFFKDFPI